MWKKAHPRLAQRQLLTDKFSRLTPTYKHNRTDKNVLTAYISPRIHASRFKNENVLANLAFE